MDLLSDRGSSALAAGSYEPPALPPLQERALTSGSLKSSPMILLSTAVKVRQVAPPSEPPLQPNKKLRDLTSWYSIKQDLFGHGLGGSASTTDWCV